MKDIPISTVDGLIAEMRRHQTAKQTAAAQPSVTKAQPAAAKPVATAKPASVAKPVVKAAPAPAQPVVEAKPTAEQLRQRNSMIMSKALDMLRAGELTASDIARLQVFRQQIETLDVA